MMFLSDRSPRERALIALALALVILMGLWMLVFRPLGSAQAEAVRAQSAAVRDYDIVQQGLPFMNQTRVDRQPFDRNAVITAARQAGISISRVQPENDGDLKVWFEDSTTDKIYAFLGELTRNYNAAVELVQMNRRPEGQVSAQITLRPLT